MSTSQDRAFDDVANTVRQLQAARREAEAELEHTKALQRIMEAALFVQGLSSSAANVAAKTKRSEES